MPPTEDPGYAAFSAKGLKVPDVVAAAVTRRAESPYAVLPWDEAKAIETAATAAHLRNPGQAEAMRSASGYGGLGDIEVPDQRHLLTDCDPLD